ncbi:type IV pilin [Halalkalirubrum salinum]|uniref:type IV pilin n=1 Tax=Halalkalirubrum salinum TaxID=2563889 RepID=UPI0010FB83F9|nr:type IV pilin [Halalkalirubrum salinum]
MLDRGAVPIVAHVLLVGLVVITAASVGGMMFITADTVPSAPTFEPDRPAESAQIDLEADRAEFTLTHQGSEPIDLDATAVEITVEDEPLRFQPTVPYFSIVGFRPGPKGAFNVAGDDQWKPNETTTIEVVPPNAPIPQAGAEVTVTVHVNGDRYATASDTA